MKIYSRKRRRCIRRKMDEIRAAECKHRGDLYTVPNIVKA